MTAVEDLLDYLTGNHMYSELEEVGRIIGKKRADKKVRHTYILGIPAFFGLGDIVEYLIDRGFAVNAVDKTNGFTALHEAAISGEEEVTKILLRHKADASICDYLGETAMDKAVFFSREEVVKLLAKY